MTMLLSRAAAAVLVGAAAMSSAAGSNAELTSQVRETEHAFAKTMADRDLGAFASFLSEEAVFLSSKGTLRGRKAVAEGWKHLFDGPRAPFAWEPERVEVLDSGTLALSTGPVYDPEGKRVGTFTSTWRREAHGKWKIVLDSGCPPCQCAEPAAK
jgi:ketosteroid isomerase-like protein